MHLFRYLLICSLFMAVVACHKEEAVIDTRKALVVVGDTCLYDNEVALIYATHNHGDDSIAFVNDYAKRWAVEMLFYKKAIQNVLSFDEIDRMVENYRKNLVINAYQDGLINQHLAPNISETEVKQFYEANRGLFVSEETMMKGFYVVIEGRVHKMNEVRRWCVRKEQEDLENLEKYCVANNVAYEFFLDEWVPAAVFVKNVPLTEFQLTERLARNGTIEFKEEGNTYFISADTILRKGDIMPLEMVETEVKELLVNSRKAEFIKERKEILYNEALGSGYLKMNM